MKNIGTGPALNVKVEKVMVRSNLPYSSGLETETSYEQIGMMNAGATKTITISCTPKVGHPKCGWASAQAHTTSIDSQPGNDWDTAPLNG